MTTIETVAKTDIVKALQEANLEDGVKLSASATRTVLDNLLEIIQEAVAAGNKVQLTGFGTFNARTRKPTTYHHIQSGEKVEVGQRVFPGFRAGKSFKDAVA